MINLKASKAQSIASWRNNQSLIDRLTLENLNLQHQIDESNQKLLSLIQQESSDPIFVSSYSLVSESPKESLSRNTSSCFTLSEFLQTQAITRDRSPPFNRTNYDGRKNMFGMTTVKSTDPVRLQYVQKMVEKSKKTEEILQSKMQSCKN